MLTRSPEGSPRNAKFYTDKNRIFCYFEGVLTQLDMKFNADHLDPLSGPKSFGKCLNFEIFTCTVNFHGYYEYTRSWQSAY